MFGIICMLPRQLPKIPPAVQQKQAARAHQSPAGYTPSHPAGKGTSLALLDMWGNAGSALPKQSLLQEKGKKKNPTDLRESAQHLKGVSLVSPSHPLFKGVF